VSEIVFEREDVSAGPPEPGSYPATVTSARIRRSQSGNRMVHVVYTLDGIAPGQDRLSDYFVLEGVSPQGIAFSRRLLVELYRACGLDPRAGEPVKPARLVGSRLEVAVDHETFRGEKRLHVVCHRPLSVGSAGDEVPF
jgi:hypothetical protein